jgi:PQQ-dependent catabolism-associated CXXCW motif protein
MQSHRRPCSAVIAGLLALATMLPCAAQTPSGASDERRVALVIGNSAYKNEPLINPGNDAADMAKALEASGFKVILRRNVNRAAMRQSIREFGDELRRATVGLFYFSGHGIQIKGSNYLVPVNEDIRSEAEAEDLSIDATLVLRTMEDAQTRVNIVILDACRNNPYARTFRSAGRGLAQMTAATGTLIAFSTAPGSIAADGSGRNGTYTKHLLESLQQPDTSVLKVFQRTRAEVVRETGKKQVPWESTSLIGEFHFRPEAATSAAPAAPAADPAASERLFWESIRNSRNPAELKAYLAQYPSGLFAGLAQARLNSLATTPAAPPTQVATIAPPTPAAAPSAARTVGEVQVFANEDNDWNVAPTSTPRRPPYHAPTPRAIPGGKVLKTVELKNLLDTDKSVVVIDVLDSKDRTSIPGSYWLSGAGSGQFYAAEKERFANALQKLTAGDKNRPVVFLCLGAECWLSYNAALHAIEAGYRNVVWYRGGTDAWRGAGYARRKVEQTQW